MNFQRMKPKCQLELQGKLYYIFHYFYLIILISPKPTSPPTSPFGRPPTEEETPATWGSNLVSILEPPIREETRYVLKLSRQLRIIYWDFLVF